MTKRILIVTGIFPPEIGGPATLAPQFGKMLQEKGYDVRLITYSDVPSCGIDNELGYPVIRIVRSNKIFNYLRFFIAVIKEAKNVDFIYSFDWVSAGLPLAFATRFIKVPFILRVGGGYIWEKYLAEGKKPMTLREFYEQKKYKGYPLLFWIIRYVFKKAKKVVFNSELQKDLYEKYYPSLKEKTVVICNPTSRISLPVVRNEDTVSNEIVYAGRFIVMKNIESLIRAFSVMKDTSKTLVLIGKGPLLYSLEKLVIKLGISSRVKFLPAMSPNELYTRIIQCRFLVIPSWTDISPNQFGEALSLRIPVILTKEHYLPIDTNSLLTIDPHSIDQMRDVFDALSDELEYRNYVNEFKSIHLNKSWDNVILDHIKLFETNTI